MTRTALDLTPEEWRTYHPDKAVEGAAVARAARQERRRRQAWRIARRAASLLRSEYGATRVVAFGSLVHDAWFTPWSDIDLAGWGIPPERFYSAVAAVTGLSSTFRVDLVDPDACRPTLRAALEREGVVL